MAIIDHIGLAVRSIEEAAAIYTRGLGLEAVHEEEVPSQGVRLLALQIGDSSIELLEPLGEGGPIAAHIAKRGEGIHHVCIRVDDIRQAMAALRDEGASLLQEEPVQGSKGSLVAFVHPKSAHGVLIELCQRPEEHAL